MTTKVMRKIVNIDEDKCTGCGVCIPNCVEGALQIVDGKATRRYTAMVWALVCGNARRMLLPLKRE